MGTFQKKMSDKWATLSMPGSIRRMKTKIFQQSTLPNDPLADARAELSDYEALLTLITTAARTITTATDMLTSAPCVLFEPLERLYSADVPGNHIIHSMVSELKMWSTRVEKAEPHLKSLDDLIAEMHKQNQQTKDAFALRDTCWNSYDHYTKKVEGIRNQMIKSGGSQALADKLNRNEHKRRDNEQAFEKSMGDANRLGSDLLAWKWQRTSEVLSKLCKYYVVLFDGVEGLVRHFVDLGDKLVSPSISEAMVQKGQQHASQSRSRFAKYQSNVRGESAEGFDEPPSKNSWNNSSGFSDAPGTHQSGGGYPRGGERVSGRPDPRPSRQGDRRGGSSMDSRGAHGAEDPFQYGGFSSPGDGTGGTGGGFGSAHSGGSFSAWPGAQNPSMNAQPSRWPSSGGRGDGGTGSWGPRAHSPTAYGAPPVARASAAADPWGKSATPQQRTRTPWGS